MLYNRTFAITTLGCKLNFSESSVIRRGLEDHAFIQKDFEDIAQYYIINTCSVTENADKKCRNLVRQILRRNPEAKIVVIGCYAQLKPNEIAQIPGVNLVLGTAEKFNLASHLEKLNNESAAVLSGEIKDVNFFKAGYSMGERTRSFLKIQDGCDYFCSFCTIPLARGRSRSGKIADIVKLADEIGKSEVKEVVLTGVNIGDFGKSESGKTRTKENFLELIKHLDEVQGIERWRISSIEPNLLNEDIISFVSHSKHFMPHFHIPLQSGDDELLTSMRRKYDTKLYKSRIEKIKSLIPHACIGVDVIVGYPGETDEHFLNTYNFLNELEISYLHVFTYSERLNTKALSIENVVPMSVRRERNKMLQILSEKKRRAFYAQFVGQNAKVLFEEEEDEAYMYGFTENYIKVRLPYDAELCNQIQNVKLSAINPFGVVDAEKAVKFATSI